jgi:hypothetical protein
MANLQSRCNHQQVSRRTTENSEPGTISRKLLKLKAKQWAATAKPRLRLRFCERSPLRHFTLGRKTKSLAFRN